MRLRLPLSLVAALVLLLVVAGRESRATAPGAVSPRLERALADPALPWRDASGRLAVWVYFRDRDLSGAALGDALAEAEAGLSDRAKRRLAKMAAHGPARARSAPLATFDDLPVAPQYLEAVAATGAHLRHESRWLNATSFDATPEQIRAIAALAPVARVDLVAKYRRTPEPEPEAQPQVVPPRSKAMPGPAAIDSASYGGSLGALAQIDVLAVHAEGDSAQGVLIGMLDTGAHTTHQALRHCRVVGAWDFVNNDPIVANQSGDPSTQDYHGTETLSALMGYQAGGMVGPAYGASVALGKTEDVSSETPIEEDNWVAGIEWLDSLGAEVVTSSLGYFNWYTFADLDGNTCVTTIAADRAVARGIVVCTAAGNERATGWGHLIAPGDADSAITVGAVGLSGAVTGFSSPGPTADGRIKPDVCALGSNVTVVSPTGTTTYVGASGTSLSTPLSAGVAALILQHGPGLTPMQVRDAMRLTASHPGSPNNDTGWGILDAHAAVHWFGPVIAHAPLSGTVSAAAAFPIRCRITDRAALDRTTPRLHWRADGGQWHVVALAPAGADSFAGAIPTQADGAHVSYYLSAADSAGITGLLPAGGAAAPFTFVVVGSVVTGVGDQHGAGNLPARTALLGAVPNPFNPRTEIRYAIARAGPGSLRLYDVRGRLVRTLVEGSLPAGNRSVVWDGRDASGRAAPSGTYFCRLAADGVAQVGRLALVR